MYCYAECCCADYHYAEYHYAECHHAECRDAACRGTSVYDLASLIFETNMVCPSLTLEH